MADKTQLETTIETKTLELEEYQAKLALRSKCHRDKDEYAKLRSAAPALDRTNKEITANDLLGVIDAALERIIKEGLLDE